MESVLLDIAGHRRSPATMPGYHRGRRINYATHTQSKWRMKASRRSLSNANSGTPTSASPHRPTRPHTTAWRIPGVRAHEVQPPLRPIRTKWQGRSPLRMATNRSHPQPPEAPQPPTRPLNRLKGGRSGRCTTNLATPTQALERRCLNAQALPDSHSPKEQSRDASYSTRGWWPPM